MSPSAPSVSSSVLIGKKRSLVESFSFSFIRSQLIMLVFFQDNITEEPGSRDEDSIDAPSSGPTARCQTMSPLCLGSPYYSGVDEYFQPAQNPRLQSPHIHTPPPSPMQPHCVVDLRPVSPVELAKQESLNELRTTVQLAASSMESSTRDIKLLREQMAAATERMTDTVQDSSQALVLLTQVVERLQLVVAATRTEFPGNRQDDIHEKTPKKRQCSSLTLQSRCSSPSFSSSSLSSSLGTPSTSQGTSCLLVSCRGSHQSAEKFNSPNLSHKKQVQPELLASQNLLTNSLLKEGSPNAKGCSSQWKKSRKKAT